MSLPERILTVEREDLIRVADARDRYSEARVSAGLKARSWCAFNKLQKWSVRMDDAHNAALRTCRKREIKDTHMALTNFVVACIDAQLATMARQGLKPEEYALLVGPLALALPELLEAPAPDVSLEPQQSAVDEGPVAEAVTPEPTKPEPERETVLVPVAAGADEFELEL